ncbi:MAG TPA: polymer-forming cytoskeletal protein [Ktedonobacteraceae bacterium]|nr:polymer-forming cytoskeletal protein [Ktedonobacteraceae bacterium]
MMLFKKSVAQKQLFMLALPGLWLLAALLISGGAEALAGGMPGSMVRASHGNSGVFTDCPGEHPGPSFGSAVVVTSGEVICGSLTSFGGEVVIRGEVRGDVVAFEGNVLIAGEVYGNVTLYGGNLTLLNGANVDGNIHVCGGRWIEGANSQLHGNVIDCTKGVGSLLSSDVGAGFRFWLVLTWVALGVLLTTLLPEHVMLVRTTVKSKMRRSLVLGLLSILLAPAVLVVLVALIIPIPLAILVAVGLIAAWALGTVAVGWLVGDYIMRKVAPHQNTRPLQVVVGLTVLALAESLPYVGLLVSLGAGLLGLGAVFLSRFGTRLYSQPKQPLPL